MMRNPRMQVFAMSPSTQLNNEQPRRQVRTIALVQPA
jgi:hypothetical protein